MHDHSYSVVDHGSISLWRHPAHLFFFFFFSLVLHGCTYYSNASPICVISQDKCNDVTRWAKFVQNFDRKFHTLFRTLKRSFSAYWRNFITIILIWIKVFSIPFLILWYEKKTTTTFSFKTFSLNMQSNLRKL